VTSRKLHRQCAAHTEGASDRELGCVRRSRSASAAGVGHPISSPSPMTPLGLSRVAPAARGVVAAPCLQWRLCPLLRRGQPSSTSQQRLLRIRTLLPAASPRARRCQGGTMPDRPCRRGGLFGIRV